MQLVPNFINERLRTSLRQRVENGSMPLMRPAVWAMSGLLPRFRDRRSLLWRVNEIEPLECPVPQLEPIWPEVRAGSSWAMPSQAVVWLWNYLERHRPRRILELGCGVSTLVFAAYAARHQADQETRIVSIDHDPSWLETLAGQLKSKSLGHSVQLVHAPICSWNSASDRIQTYSPGKIRQAIGRIGGQVDLVLIDGPPAHLHGRSGTLPSVVNNLAPSGVVLLDDACRPHEYDLCRRWQRQFAGMLTWQGTVPIGHGIAIFTRDNRPTNSPRQPSAASTGAVFETGHTT